MGSASQKRAQPLSKINGNMLISPKCKIIFSYHPFMHYEHCNNCSWKTLTF